MAPWVAAATILARSATGTPMAARRAGSTAVSRPVTMAPSSAIPNTPPISRLVLVVADAIPARAAGTELMTAAVIGVIVSPMPTPMTVKIHHSWE